MTSNITPHLTPRNAPARRYSVFSIFQPCRQRWMFKEMGVIGQRVQTIRRELVDYFLDLVTQLGNRHW